MAPLHLRTGFMAALLVAPCGAFVAPAGPAHTAVCLGKVVGNLRFSTHVFLEWAHDPYCSSESEPLFYFVPSYLAYSINKGGNYKELQSCRSKTIRKIRLRGMRFSGYPLK